MTEKKYFDISLILNTLFYILAISAPGFIQLVFPINYLFGISFTTAFNIGLMILLIIVPAIFGLIYLFIAENKKWIILGLLIDILSLTVVTLLFLVFFNLQAHRNI